MKIYTSYFGNVTKIIKNNPDAFFVCIAGYAPWWFKNTKGRKFSYMPEIAPRKVWWQEWHEKFGSDPDSDESVAWYTDKYLSTVLCKIQPYELVDRLHAVCSDDDATFVLLCYEPPDKFCHRHVVREWFNQHEWSCKHDMKIEEINL